MKGLLKFITCGSVDDGKSTLIGHILYDAKLLYADQERALELDSKAGSRGGKIDYSLLLDGLMEEREQGITIDVAYRYFTTDYRSFIVADTPGHEEYTRNMAVGASFAELAVILIDASQGVLIQTRRHARICALMGIRYFVFAVNKMDLIDYQEEGFRGIEAQVHELAKELRLTNVQIIPVSATEGDNVTRRSAAMPWYEGPVLLQYLETVDIAETATEEGFYMPVQRVCRPDHTFRGFQGQIEAGEVHVGDTLQILPSREQANVRSILVGSQTSTKAFTGQPVTIQLDREVDVSRGCVLVSGTQPKVISSFTATLLWMDEDTLENGKNFFVKLGTRMIPGEVTKIETVIDVNTGEEHRAACLNKNEIATCRITLTDRVAADTFERHAALGELILIDRISFKTAACGVITEIPDAQGLVHQSSNESLRLSLKGQMPAAAVFIEGKDPVTIENVYRIERILAAEGRHTYLYAPNHGTDYRNVVKHLLRAGIIILLVISEDQASSLDLPPEICIREWETVTEPEDIAALIRKKTFLPFDDMGERAYI